MTDSKTIRNNATQQAITLVPYGTSRWIRLQVMLADILDDETGNSAISRRANTVLVWLIGLSVLTLILETERTIAGLLGGWLHVIDLAIIGIFTVEYVLRIWLAPRIAQPMASRAAREIPDRWRRRKAYLLGFHGIVDALAIVPVFVGLLLPIHVSGLRLLRLARIFLFTRYSKSFILFSNALHRKRTEVLVAIQVVVALTVILSVIIYEIESAHQPSKFGDVPSALAWALAKFIGGVGGYGDFHPITTSGKMIATLIGVLGIAIFAVPAGIVASGFVEEISKLEKEKKIKEKRRLILSAFRPLRKSAAGVDLPSKNVTLITAQSRLQISEQEIMDIVDSTAGVRLRHKKEARDSKYFTTLIIESFLENRKYGGCIDDRSGRVAIVCTVGYIEQSISHFVAGLAQILDADQMCNEFFGTDDALNVDRAFNFKRHYRDAPPGTPAQCEAFDEWKRDLAVIANRNDLVIVFTSSASRKKDFHVVFGGAVGQEGFHFDGSTVRQPERVESFLTGFSQSMQEIRPEFTVATHESFGGSDGDGIHQYLRAISTADTVTMYLNIDILEWAPDNMYYGTMRRLADAIKVHLLRSDLHGVLEPSEVIAKSVSALPEYAAGPGSLDVPSFTNTERS